MLAWLQNLNKIYSITLSFPWITVDGPRNLRISPIQSIYHPGDILQCSAEGNPTPSYQWTDLVSGNVTKRAFLDITEGMLDETHTFQCTASNRYNGLIYATTGRITFIVQVKGTSTVLAFLCVNLAPTIINFKRMSSCRELYKFTKLHLYFVGKCFLQYRSFILKNLMYVFITWLTLRDYRCLFTLRIATLTSTVDGAASCNAYKSATIALAVIAGVAIAIIVLLIAYIVRRMPSDGLFIALSAFNAISAKEFYTL